MHVYICKFGQLMYTKTEMASLCRRVSEHGEPTFVYCESKSNQVAVIVGFTKGTHRPIYGWNLANKHIWGEIEGGERYTASGALREFYLKAKRTPGGIKYIP